MIFNAAYSSDHQILFLGVSVDDDKFWCKAAVIVDNRSDIADVSINETMWFVKLHPMFTRNNHSLIYPDPGQQWIESATQGSAVDYCWAPPVHVKYQSFDPDASDYYEQDQ